MPTPEHFAMEEAFLASNGTVCGCGNPTDEHALTVDGIKDTPFVCSLTRDEVPKWNMIADQFRPKSTPTPSQ